MPVRKRLQGPQYGIYTSCIKEGKGNGKASNGSCCQIAIFLIKRTTQFSRSREEARAEQATSQARAWGRREEREIEQIISVRDKTKRTDCGRKAMADCDRERCLQGRAILVMVRLNCFHLYIALHLASGPQSRVLYPCTVRPLFDISEKAVESVRLCGVVDSPFYSHRHAAGYL